MNNKEYITELAQQAGYTQSVAQTLVRTVVDEMAARFDDGDSVSIPGFGTFEVKKRLERNSACWFHPSWCSTSVPPPR